MSVAKFRVSQVGKEKINSFHRVNAENLSEDPVIKEFDADYIKSTLRVTQTNFRDQGAKPVRSNNNVDNEEETQSVTPLSDILSSVTKEEVVKKKKKRPTTTTSLDEEKTPLNPSSTAYQPPQQHEIVLSYARPQFNNPANYFGAQNVKTTSAIKVTTYNKGFERDLM